ncbi:putative endo-beta-1,4-glucanase D 10 [Colletotrichum chlorophyti]|uniref:lytic cellulose monooxygenase (C4-dehydrogenating) n=1 Tax=Colletotrichum chlorophyti TaxID=708187 RepID=A0A1Q8S294_9PEZI|nr:putative endo-beta-1,4-glucanase D 10 [Colletotrichum chlorophyti]
MKFSVVALAAMVPFTTAHYFFDTISINGVSTKSFQYVRSNTRPNKYNPTKWSNIRDDMTPDMADIRCNKGSFSFASKTGTLEVKAGSKVSFKVNTNIQHPGPAFVYMSKAPSTAKTYQGDGDWFKVYETGVCNKGGDFTKGAWCTYGKSTVEFTVPKDTPNGEYLMRVEHIGVHGAHVGQAEFYQSCAQVKITGGGNGKPGPMVKFPGAYKKTDPSFNFSIYNGYKAYPMPGPAVWTGGNAKRSVNETETEEADLVAPVDIVDEVADSQSESVRRSRIFRE